MQQAHSYSAAGECLAAALLHSNALGKGHSDGQESSPVRLIVSLTFLPEGCTTSTFRRLAHSMIVRKTSLSGTPEPSSRSDAYPKRDMHATGQPGLSYHHPPYSAQPILQQYVQPFGSPFQAPGQALSNGMLHGQLQQPVAYHFHNGAPVQSLTHSQQYAGNAQQVQQPYCAYSGGNLQATALHGDSRTCDAYSAAGLSEQQRVAPSLMPPLPPDSELGNAYIPPPPPPS